MRNELEIAETTEDRQERLWDELQYRKTMLRVIKRLCLWIGGCAGRAGLRGGDGQ